MNGLPRPLPSLRRQQWQKMDFYLFAHSGPNTFTDLITHIGRSLAGCLIALATPLLMQAQAPAPPQGWSTTGNLAQWDFRPRTDTGFLYSLSDPHRLQQGNTIQNELEKTTGNAAGKIGAVIEKTSVQPIVQGQPGLPVIYAQFLTVLRNGQKRSVSGMGYALNDRTARFAQISYPTTGNYKPLLDVAVKHLLEMARQDLRHAGETSGPSGNFSAPTSNSPAATGNSPVTTITDNSSSGLPATPPADALQSSGIEGYYFVAIYSYGAGGMMTSEFEPYLLLKDGSICRHLSIPPEYLQVAVSKRQEPQKWGKWTRAGNKILVNWDDGKNENWGQWYTGMPASDGERLSGTYRSLGGGGGGGVTTFDARSITFAPDGRFTTDRQKGAVSDNGPWGGKTAQTKGAGSYHFHGYTLTLQYDNGKTLRFPFLFYSETKTGTPRKNTGAFIVGDNNYTLDK